MIETPPPLVPDWRATALRRRGSFGSDSGAGSLFAERLLSVVATCRQQEWRLLDFLVAAGEAALQESPRQRCSLPDWGR